MRKRGTHAVDLRHRLYSSLIIEQLLTPTRLPPVAQRVALRRVACEAGV